MNWTNERPTEPGWYWYRDEEYGPAPVYVEWFGFISDPDARYLSIGSACGEEYYWPSDEVAKLTGAWAGPIPIPQEAA